MVNSLQSGNFVRVTFLGKRRSSMLRKPVFLIAVILLVAGGMAWAQPANPLPQVEILSPQAGYATNQGQLSVAVWFSAYKDKNGKPVGNVHTVKLLLNGQVVATYQNPPQVKSGGTNFTVDISVLPEGTATLVAQAFQGNEKAGLMAATPLMYSNR
jgi:hypothetical protein